MTISNNFPAIAPSLQLNFAQTKDLDPRVSFSRPTTATYYDNHTTVVAEQNLLIYSEQFDNAAWVKDGGATVTANNTTAPDGTTTADLVQFPAQFASVRTNASVLTIGIQYTYSIYCRVASGTRDFAIRDNNGNPISTFTATTTWQRFTATFTAPSTSSLVAIQDRGASGFVDTYIWGAQLEQRSSVTAYTPTTTTAITNYIPVLLTQQSNEARFDHNPTTRESLGLLIEEQRTNLLTYSSDFSNAAWVTSAATITTVANIAPDGAQTANKIIPTATGPGNHYIRNSGITATAATSYTTSIYVKASGYSSIWLRLLDNGGNTEVASSFFSVSGSGSVLSTGTGTASITSVGNGWFRCSITGTATVGGTAFAYFYVTNGTTNSITGDGFNGLFIWGAQLEAGAFATSYIPTVASQVTRSADSASMTGANFSSWYNAGQGTVYTEAQYLSSSSITPNGRHIWFVSDGTGNNFVDMYNRGGFQSGVYTIVNGAQQASIQSGSASSTFGKTVFTIQPSSGYLYTNGSIVGTQQTAPLIPSVNQINIGNSLNQSASYLNGYIKKLAYYPIAVSSANLIALTGN